MSRVGINSDKNSQNDDKSEHNDAIDWIVGKMSNSAGKLHKYVSKTKQSEPEKKKMPQISPLLPKKTEFGVLSPESSHYGRELISERPQVEESARLSNRTISPRKALDFANKTQQYKGRNLFDEDYQ